MQLNYKSFGRGPALIILHGLFGSLDNWQTLARRYAEDFSVFIIDQRNHGKSPHADAPFTYATLAEDLSTFMDEQGIYSTHLIGHSMGGKVAIQFATEWPERLEKLIVADMGIRQYEPHHNAIFDALLAFPLKEITTRKDAEKWLLPRIPDFATRQFILKSLIRDPEGGFSWKFNLEVIHRDYKYILSAVQSSYPIEVETLFVRGEKSGYIKQEDEKAILLQFPNATFRTISNAGHWLHAEAPKEFLSISSSFLLG